MFIVIRNFGRWNNNPSALQFSSTYQSLLSHVGPFYYYFLVATVAYILKPVIRQLTMLKELVISEGKYSFTPDILKDNTRQKCQSNSHSTVAHLRTSEILSKDQWNTDATRTISWKGLDWQLPCQVIETRSRNSS